MENLAKEIVSVKCTGSRKYFATLEDGETAVITRQQYFAILSKSADGETVYLVGNEVLTLLEIAV